MKRALALILALIIGSMTATMVYANDDFVISDSVTISGGPEAQYVNPFTDVSEDAWYYEAVMYACISGLVNGKTPTTYCPDDYLTYAEALKLAACMHQRYIDGKVTLVNGDPWYQTYVDYCFENKIIKKEYPYNENATRAGYMEIFSKALPDKALEEINNIEVDSIPDVPSSAAYADGIYKLYCSGIVTGIDEKHNCNPEANIKRSEVAVIVQRMMVPEKRVRFDLKSVYGSTIDSDTDIDISGKESVEIVIPDGSEITLPDDDVDIKDGKESVEIVIPDGSQMTDKDNTSDIDYGNPSVGIKIPGEREVIAPDKDETEDDTTVTVLPGKQDQTGQLIVGSGIVTETPDKDEDEDNDIDDTQVPDNQEPPQSIISNNDKITFDPVLNPTQTIYTALTIVKQPKNYEADKYGIKTELEVEAKGGKEPYSYQWFYYTGYRNNKDKIVSGDYVKDVTSDALVLSIEKENTLLGQQIYCEITDAEGTKVRTDTVKVYGPFSMPVKSVEIKQAAKSFETKQAAREYVLAGTVADGRLAKGDKISVVRNGKIIAIGTATDLQMFGKSLDEALKGNSVGIVFALYDGVRPTDGDMVIKYKAGHVIDTSDIVN